jgi:hemoglobin
MAAAFWILAGCATGTTPSAPASGHPVIAGVGQAPAAPLPSAAAGGSLYQRLGGKDAITAVVDELLARLVRDDRVNRRFANADIPHLRLMLIDQICEATGGPCKYTGKDMRTSHAGMRILDSEFDALVQDLKAALDQLKVPLREQNDLLGALAPMKPDIAQEGAGHPVVGPMPASGGSPITSVGGRATPADPVAERAQAVREAASLLEKANAARLRGSRSFAEQLFSSAELIMGSEAVADLATLFREGAPPRVNTPLKTLPRDTPPQPAAVGSSEEEEPDSRPRRGSLAGTVLLPGGHPLQGLAVVTLEPASGKFTRRLPKHRVVEQRNREFAPKVLVVPTGSTVSFPNFDNVYHNVFSRSDAYPFDLGLYKGGQARELLFDKQGIIRVGCNLHANMSAYVVVVAAPHYVITDPRGRFAFRSLEAGRYKLRAWLENSDVAVVQNVDIKPEQNGVVVTLLSEGPAGPQADKFGVPRVGAIRK